MSSKEDVVLITGAAQGIGEAITLALASPKKIILLCDLNVGKLHQVAIKAKQRGAEVHMFPGDLTDNLVRTKLYKEIMLKYGHVDVLVNNAGIAHPLKPIEEISNQEFDHSFLINVKIPFQLTKAFVPLMKERGKGLIINMSSSANIWGYKHHSVYAATKAALTSFTESTAQEVEGTGVKAIAVLPSRTNTPLNEALRGKVEALSSQPADYVGKIVAEIITGKIKVQNGDDVRIEDGNYLVEEDISTGPLPTASKP